MFVLFSHCKMAVATASMHDSKKYHCQLAAYDIVCKMSVRCVNYHI